MQKLVSRTDGTLIYELLRHWTQDGHEVAWMRLTNSAVPENASSYLLCECDFDEEDYVVDGKVVGKTRKNDPHACEAKKKVRQAVLSEARLANAEAWSKLSLKEAVLEIKARVDARAWLGQHYDAMIYTQEVAELLGRTDEEVLAACGELYAEERLDLNGRILADFVPGFRFPREMAAILRYIVEEPLGWPNGDAGEGYVAGLEREIQEKHGFTSGKQAFGADWPNMSGDVLAILALAPVANTLRSVAKLHPHYQGSDEETARLVEECVASPPIAKPLEDLEPSPEIRRAAFEEFIRALVRLSIERVEIDRQMRTPQVPPAQTLRELADWLDKVAEHLRSKAKA